MSNYTQSTFFAPKDALVSGNPAKLIKGTEVDVELDAIADAIATKRDADAIVLVPSGTSSAPSLSFITDTNSGFFNNAPNEVAAVADGLPAQIWMPDGAGAAISLFPVGAAARPSIAFIGDTDTGFYHPSANATAIVAGGVEVMRWAAGASGLVIGQTGVAYNIRFNNITQSTVGAAGPASALPAAPLGYLTVNVNGGDVKIPYYNA